MTSLRRKVRGASTPPWALDSKALNKWKNLYGVMLFQNHEAQVLFRDVGTPIALALLRPMNLRRDNRTIIGTFLLADPEKNVREWVMGVYYGGIGAFVVNAAPEHLEFVINHPNRVSYLDQQARERVTAQLASEEKKGRRKCRSKHLESDTALGCSSEWAPISSWERN